MASETEITVRGRLGANPELQETPGKKPWLRLRVATNRRVRNGEEWTDGPTSWYDVKLWGDFAKNVAQSVRKGDAVIVQGELYIEEYTNENGITFRTAVIHANGFGPDLFGAVASIMRVNRNEVPPVDVSRMEELPGADGEQGATGAGTLDDDADSDYDGSEAEEKVPAFA